MDSSTRSTSCEFSLIHEQVVDEGGIEVVKFLISNKANIDIRYVTNSIHLYVEMEMEKLLFIWQRFEIMRRWLSCY